MYRVRYEHDYYWYYLYHYRFYVSISFYMYNMYTDNHYLVMLCIYRHIYICYIVVYIYTGNMM